MSSRLHRTLTLMLALVCIAAWPAFALAQEADKQTGGAPETEFSPEGLFSSGSKGPKAEHLKPEVKGWLQKGQAAMKDAKYDVAMTWFRKAADAGSGMAMGAIGDMYSQGQGVGADITEAAKWWHQAADRGRPAAMNSIGLMYQNGNGVKQDYVEALKWFKKAADGDDIHGMTNVGIMYGVGLGVTKDYIEANKWFLKAAEQDDAEAIYCIGVSYFNGWGAKRDYIMAVKCFKESAADGYAGAKMVLDELGIKN